jgi:histidyl-tRNA synthetase
MIQLIRGFKDILPEEIETWKHVEQTAISLFESFGFKGIRLPILEKAALFQRSIGEHTDIVEKEMYTFPSSKGELITMRPEATASVVRSYIQQKLYAKDPVQKLYTIGPMFRKERPQKGRYRQFYQINAEVFGIDSPYIDAQLIFLLQTFFSRLSITGLTVLINSLGCPACRPKFKEALFDILKSKTADLCSNCVRRLDKNPMRILDCKVPSCQAAISDVPSMTDYICDDCEQHFNTVRSALEAQKIQFEINPRLVRGLDYYTRTAFEIQTNALGAQNAIAGGGRYDGLVHALGGPKQPAVGFAIGVDRLVELMSQDKPHIQLTPDIFIAALGDGIMEKAFDWSCALGENGIKTEIDFSGKSLKSLMKRANRVGAAHVLIAGSQEIEEGALILRNMETKEQISVPINGVVDHIKKIIGQTTS